MFKPVAIATLTLGLTCFAQGPHRGGGGGGIEHLKSFLSLTDSQVQAMQQSRTAQRESMRANSEELRSKESALREQMQSGAADPATVGRLVIETQAARKKMQSARKASSEQFLSSLTAEQRTKLQTLQEAAKLQPAIHEAMGLGLIEPPTGSGNGFAPMMRPGGGRGPGGPAPAFRGGAAQRF